MVPYQVALTAVFVEGFVFVGLTMLGIRQWLARYVNRNHARIGSLLPYVNVIQLGSGQYSITKTCLAIHDVHLV